MTSELREILQPIHPSLRLNLDPQYVAFHEEHLQYIKPSEETPWHPDMRKQPSPMRLGGLAKAIVGSVQDLDHNRYQLRVFTPQGSKPENGWPCLIWFHGGGFVVGGLDSENAFLTIACKRAACVVVTVNYRHAPEHVYPAAVDDAISALEWAVSPTGSSALEIDVSRVAVGGLSAGGGLAAVLSMKSSLLASHVPLRGQLLICPVIDNTATSKTVWSASQHAAWLTPRRMIWYRDKYLPDPSLGSQWTASPCFAPQDVLEKSPKTFIAISECDLLAPEERLYADQLRGAGVEVQTVECKHTDG
ncbi:hypothetical protein LTR85_000065 [Meristemomyces frigidus]|nr:hypothetical protein LTR85_000065 [Meristemomyces frigidus]